MHIAALAALAVGQTFQGVRVPLALEDYAVPTLGGQREFVLGAQPLGLRIMGVFKVRPTGYAKLPNGRREVINFDEDKLGDLRFEVRQGEFQGQPCWRVETGGSVRQTLKERRSKQQTTWINAARRTFWVSFQGHLLRDSYQFTTPGGAWSMDATFGDRQAEATFGTPTGERKATIHLAQGTAGFDAAFRPMLKDGKVVLTRKEFWLLDPFTGTPRWHLIEAGSPFTSKNPGSPGKGRTFLFKGPRTDYRAFVRDDGELLRVEWPDERFAEGSIPVELKPSR